MCTMPASLQSLCNTCGTVQGRSARLRNQPVELELRLEGAVADGRPELAEGHLQCSARRHLPATQGLAYKGCILASWHPGI